MLKINIQLFGGRGASSGANIKAIEIIFPNDVKLSYRDNGNGSTEKNTAFDISLVVNGD